MRLSFSVIIPTLNEELAYLKNFRFSIPGSGNTSNTFFVSFWIISKSLLNFVNVSIDFKFTFTKYGKISSIFSSLIKPLGKFFQALDKVF